jgi:lysozyme
MENINDSVFKDYPYWIARCYVVKLKFRGQWTFWQYTDVGHVSGIGSRQEDVVDCNIFNGTLQELLDLTIREEQIDNIEQ